MGVLAKYTLKLSCTGLLDFKTTKIHITPFAKFMAKFILPNSNGNFTKQSYLGTLEFMKLFYIGERYVVCSAFVYTPSPFLPASIALHSLYCTYSIPYCAML